MSIPVYGPIIFLRCKKCGRKTDHVLIYHATIATGEIEETYECQQCGETKKIFELACASEKSTIQELKQKIKAKRVVDLEKRLEEPQKKRRLF